MGGDYPPIENKLDTCGMFTLPGSIHAGDLYVRNKMPQLSRHSGKQMLVPGTVWGTNQDAMIDKEYKRLSENDVYLDPAMRERAGRKKIPNISEKAFLPSSPMKTTTGKGTHVGCFSPIEYVAVPENPKSSSAPGLKNFVIKTAVKGGYGRTGHFLGEPPEFIADPFLRGRQVEKEHKSKARDRIGKPMIAGGRSMAVTGLFDNNIYAEEPGPTYRERRKVDLKLGKAFREPGPNRSGAHCTFSYPEYIEDPEKERVAAATAARIAARPTGPGFKLSGGGGSSWYTTDVNPFKTPARVKPEIDLLN